MSVGRGDGVLVAVSVGEFVGVDVRVVVDVFVAVGRLVEVLVGVFVGGAVGVGFSVAVKVSVAVTVLVGVPVEVLVAVAGLGVLVGTLVGEAVAVAVRVGSGEGVTDGVVVGVDSWVALGSAAVVCVTVDVLAAVSVAVWSPEAAPADCVRVLVPVIAGRMIDVFVTSGPRVSCVLSLVEVAVAVGGVVPVAPGVGVGLDAITDVLVTSGAAVTRLFVALAAVADISDVSVGGAVEAAGKVARAAVGVMLGNSTTVGLAGSRVAVGMRVGVRVAGAGEVGM